MNAVTVRPFRPFCVPAAVTYGEAADIQALRRWGESAVRVETLEEVLAGLLGCDVTLAPRGICAATQVERSRAESGSFSNESTRAPTPPPVS